jgi:hypothetical protein
MDNATPAPRFTIIIPTRERAATLEHALRTVTDQAFASLEIIVSDNASTDNTRAIVEANGDPRIRYLNTGKRISMAHNWEFALGHARGEWVGFIGDDDGLLPDSLERVDTIARANPVDLIRSRPGNFLWPSLLGTQGGHLSLPIGGRSRVRRCDEALKAVLAGDESYLSLPTLYTGGYVRRAALDRARAPDGTFFLSRIPDVYSAVVLCATCETFYWSAYPLAINGASMASTGTSQFTKSNDPERQKAERQFAQEDNIPLHASLPFNPDGSVPRSLQALVFESYQQARAVDPIFGPLDPAQQMAAIARTAGVHRDEVSVWLKDFGALHGVASVPDPGLSRRLNDLAALARNACMDRLIFYPDSNPPITTVAEASRIGGAALAAAPGVAATVIRNTVRRIGRAIGG